jgi:signal transduction histidine kinase/DNA-binding response OmpR family regulator/ligand-binding sensor domain-containing protein
MMQKLQHRKRGLLLGLFLLAVGLYGDTVQNGSNENAGFKYLKNYSRSDYKHHAQNWSIVQDSRGIIYVGNLAGVLEYDGVSWRIFENVPNKSVRSMSIDNTGTIYIGGIDEIGFLKPDAKGALYYVSLLPEVDKNKRNISTVWKTLAAGDSVYFLTSKYLLRWNTKTGKMKIWEAERYFKDIFYVKGKVFINEKATGLREMVHDSFQSLPGGTTFADDRIYLLVPFNSSELMLATNKGMCRYNYNNGIIIPFPTEADGYLKEKRLSHGIGISNGNFALATFTGGLVIIDSRGHVKHIFDKSSGLQDTNVKHVFQDSTGCLWLALNNGISKIEYASPLSLYDHRNRLEGVVYSIVRHQGDLYVGTSNGLFHLPSAGGPGSLKKFSPIAGITGNCWSLLSTGAALFAAVGNGIFQVENQRARKVIDKRGYCLLHSRHDANRIWAGTAKGLYSLYFKDNRWQKESLFQINVDTRTISEDQQGHLWLGTLTRGVVRIQFTGPGMEPVVKPYNTGHGLPGGAIHVFTAAGHVSFATEKGLYRFNEQNQVFDPDYTLGETFAGGGAYVFRMAEDIDKHIWFHSRGLNYHAEPRADGSCTIEKTPLLRILIAQVNTIYPENDIVWFGSVDGLICYDKRVKKNYCHQYRAFIRKVQLVKGKSLVFDGYQIKAGEKPLFPIFDYRDRNLRIHYAAPFFENESAVRYSYFLEGGDNVWSDWTDETLKDYTNLDAGVYTFRVRAKNVYEHLSEEAAFQFKVLSPWYLTWWAFLAYAALALLIMYLVVGKWRSWRLVREKQKLEQIVEERTRQINQQKLELLEQAEKLKEMDQLKSRFFANISHEFRTPLTLIMDPLEQMLPGCREEKQKRQLSMMRRNSRRLLALINQLLELSKYDSGKVKLLASRQNIIPLLKGMVSSFEIAAAENDLEMTFQAREEEIELYIDPEKIETVMINLLGNAFKFTPAGGKITVTVKKNTGPDENFPAGWLEIRVCDTGPGIPREQLAHIFDRFYQADAAHEHHQKGTGIGLAIAKEIVELHHGTIGAHSRETRDSVTEFIIRLPLGNAHLEPGEIVETAAPAPISPDKIREEISPVEQWENEAEDMEEMEAHNGTLIEPGDQMEMNEKDIILVVEDSADLREHIKLVLEPLYRVLTAADGREGIEKALEIIPDLIVSDIMMPELDGYELCRELKNHRDTSHIPIILLTAKADEENIIQGLETGADDYITKPFNTNILKARIKNLLDLRRHYQEIFQRERDIKPVKKSVSQMDEEFKRDLKKVINKNISDPEFNVEDLSKKMYMGRTNLYRKIRALTGVVPNELIRSYRLNRGAKLLEKGMSVLEVSVEVGFASAGHFSRCFSKKFHISPTSYKASMAKSK